jgi:hypothetical protein
MAAEYGTDLLRNRLGITVPGLDYQGHVGYVPDVITYAGLTIAVGGANGTPQAIGRVQSWQRDAITRTQTMKWELSREAFGRPIEIIPGKADGYAISVERIELWSMEMEIALGYPAVFSDLMDMRWSVDLYEYKYRGNDLYRLWKYPNCWMSSLGEGQPSSEGDGIYIGTASFSYLPRIRMV